MKLIFLVGYFNTFSTMKTKFFLLLLICVTLQLNAQLVNGPFEFNTSITGEFAAIAIRSLKTICPRSRSNRINFACTKREDMVKNVDKNHKCAAVPVQVLQQYD